MYIFFLITHFSINNVFRHYLKLLLQSRVPNNMFDLRVIFFNKLMFYSNLSGSNQNCEMAKREGTTMNDGLLFFPFYPGAFFLLRFFALLIIQVRVSTCTERETTTTRPPPPGTIRLCTRARGADASRASGTFFCSSQW